MPCPIYILLTLTLLLLIVNQILASPPILFPPSAKTLQLRYPNGEWISPGQSISRRAAKDPPIISTAGLTPESTYIILFIDLDVLLNDTTATVILHWYQPDLVANTNTNTNTNTSTSTSTSTDTNHKNPNFYSSPTILKPNNPENGNQNLDTNTTNSRPAPYIGPRAPPGTRHRYVFLLFEQPSGYVFPSCFGHVFPMTVAARKGFDVAQFVRVAGLGVPVAVNWFWGGDKDGGGEVSSVTTSLRVAPCETQSIVAGAGTGVGRDGVFGYGYHYPDPLQVVL